MAFNGNLVIFVQSKTHRNGFTYEPLSIPKCNVHCSLLTLTYSIRGCDWNFGFFYVSITEPPESQELFHQVPVFQMRKQFSHLFIHNFPNRPIREGQIQKRKTD